MKLYISKCETAPNNITVWEQSRVFQTHVPAEPTAFLLGLAALRQEGCPAASGLPVSVWQAAVTGFPVVWNSDLPGSSCPFPKTCRSPLWCCRLHLLNFCRQSEILGKVNAYGQFPGRCRTGRRSRMVRGSCDLNKLETFPDVVPSPFSALVLLSGRKTALSCGPLKHHTLSLSLSVSTLLSLRNRRATEKRSIFRASSTSQLYLNLTENTKHLFPGVLKGTWLLFPLPCSFPPASSPSVSEPITHFKTSVQI